MMKHTIEADRAERRVTFPFRVAFDTFIDGKPASSDHTLAKFVTQGEAVAFATMAFSQFPSAHRQGYRRYRVWKNRKLVYVAG